MAYLLLTGASGFIGTNLIAYLESINSPILDRLVILSSVKHNKYPTILHSNYSLTKDMFKGYDIESILHLGAFIPKASEEINDFFNNTSNINSTLSLIETLPDSVRYFVYISTTDVYSDSNNLIDEAVAVGPSTIYGYSKVYCEKMVEQWCSQKNITLQILRIGHIYGKGEGQYKKLIPETIRKVINNEVPVIYATGEESRSFLNAKDCVRLIFNSLDLKFFAGPINIVSSVSYSVKEIVEMIISISGKKLLPRILNQNIIMKNLVFDCKKMHYYLGKESISLYAGLKEEYKYFEQ
jgi:nucleoside-diphosphate-sugar epimerase